MTLQGNLNKAKCDPDQLPRKLSHEIILSTWEGPGPWDPERGLTGKHIVKSKGPVEAMDIAVGIDAPQQNVAAGIVAHKNNSGCAEVKSVCQHIPRSQPCTFTPIPSSHPTIIKSTCFSY